MPPFRRTDSRRNCLGYLSTGAPVYAVEYDIEKELDNLYTEINSLKLLINKKYDRIADLKLKLALKKQEEKHKKEIEHLREKYRRDTLFLINELNLDDSESDTVLAKSAEEHLNNLCNNNN